MKKGKEKRKGFMCGTGKEDKWLLLLFLWSWFIHLFVCLFVFLLGQEFLARLRHRKEHETRSLARAHTLAKTLLEELRISLRTKLAWAQLNFMHNCKQRRKNPWGPRLAGLKPGQFFSFKQPLSEEQNLVSIF